jgi:hypothetical protein
VSAWFSFNRDEQRDADRVRALEARARDAHDPGRAAGMLLEADQLRERWGYPRHQFASIAEIVTELREIARALELEALEENPGALYEFAERAGGVGSEIERFAADIEELLGDD